jgi:RNA polymerase sigma-70 factor (ECF subfamily)
MGDNDGRFRCWTEACHEGGGRHAPSRVVERHARARGEAEARSALAAFCEAAWPTVHACVRARGYRGADAEDLTQAYFARFIERGDLEYAASWRGCRRGFLSVSVRHFLSNERDRERAAKRGGGRPPLSLDSAREGRPAVAEPAWAETPETLLARSQAQATIHGALDVLRREMEQAGCAERLARVEGYLLDEVNTGSYRRMAAEWGIGEAGARVTLHRLRKRLAELLRRALLPRARRLRGPGWA